VSALLASGWSLVAWLGLVAAIVHLALAHRGGPRSDALAWTWRAIAVVGFAITWTFMIRMAVDDVARYPNLAAWGRESNLFFDAYRRVTGTAPAWWWSQQLMAWALVGTLWFAVEGRRRALRFWAYPWLAMCVAVSVTLPLFAQRLRRAEVVEAGAGVALPVGLGVGLAALALIAAPFVTGTAFVVAMLVLHAALLVPAILTARSSGASRALPLRPLARGVALVCFALHVVATVRLRALPLRALAEVVARDPAQASITSDVVLTWLACTVLVAASRGRRRALAFAVAAPFVSLGAAFAWAVLSETHTEPNSQM
jgi:hypothetical protein